MDLQPVTEERVFEALERHHQAAKKVKRLIGYGWEGVGFKIVCRWLSEGDNILRVYSIPHDINEGLIKPQIKRRG
jgi:hypothetical protein